MSDVQKQLFTLNKASKKSVALYHKFAVSVGISDSSLGVLYALMHAETPCTQYDLCNEWSIPKQTINTTVNALQKRGFVYLSQASGTRNKKIVGLTAAGKEFAQKTVGTLLEAELSAFEELTNEERELYIRLNRKYNETLTEKLDDFLKN